MYIILNSQVLKTLFFMFNHPAFYKYSDKCKFCFKFDFHGCQFMQFAMTRILNLIFFDVLCLRKTNM